MPDAPQDGPRFGPNPRTFRMAFGVGDDDRRIHPVDAIGVPLAAIQALHELVVRQQHTIDELRERIDRAERQHTLPLL